MLPSNSDGILIRIGLISPVGPQLVQKRDKHICPVNSSAGKEVSQFNNGVILTQATLWVLRVQKGTVAGRKRGCWGRKDHRHLDRRRSIWLLLRACMSGDMTATLRQIMWRLGYSTGKSWADDQNATFFNSFINCGVKKKLEKNTAGSEDNTLGNSNFNSWKCVRRDQELT